MTPAETHDFYHGFFATLSAEDLLHFFYGLEDFYDEKCIIKKN